MVLPFSVSTGDQKITFGFSQDRNRMARQRPVGQSVGLVASGGPEELRSKRAFFSWSECRGGDRCLFSCDGSRKQQLQAESSSLTGSVLFFPKKKRMWISRGNKGTFLFLKSNSIFLNYLATNTSSNHDCCRRLHLPRNNNNRHLEIRQRFSSSLRLWSQNLRTVEQSWETFFLLFGSVVMCPFSSKRAWTCFLMFECSKVKNLWFAIMYNMFFFVQSVC